MGDWGGQSTAQVQHPGPHPGRLSHAPAPPRGSRYPKGTGANLGGSDADQSIEENVNQSGMVADHAGSAIRQNSIKSSESQFNFLACQSVNSTDVCSTSSELQNVTSGNDTLVRSSSGSVKVSQADDTDDTFDISSIAVTPDDDIVVSAVEHKRVYKFTLTGELVFAYPSDRKSSCLNNGVIPDGDNSSTCINQSRDSNQLSNHLDRTDEAVFSNGLVSCDSNGLLAHDPKSTGQDTAYLELPDANGMESGNSPTEPDAIGLKFPLEPELKCPIALCVDPFGNILVADFTADGLLLLSPSGRFLGQPLTTGDGVACPSLVSVDPGGEAGLLYVGQYGGEVRVFRYLSCVKRV